MIKSLITTLLISEILSIFVYNNVYKLWEIMNRYTMLFMLKANYPKQYEDLVQTLREYINSKIDIKPVTESEKNTLKEYIKYGDFVDTFELELWFEAVLLKRLFFVNKNGRVLRDLQTSGKIPLVSRDIEDILDEYLLKYNRIRKINSIL